MIVPFFNGTACQSKVAHPLGDAPLFFKCAAVGALVRSKNVPQEIVGNSGVVPCLAREFQAWDFRRIVYWITGRDVGMRPLDIYGNSY